MLRAPRFFSSSLGRLERRAPVDRGPSSSARSSIAAAPTSLDTDAARYDRLAAVVHGDLDVRAVGAAPRRRPGAASPPAAGRAPVTTVTSSPPPPSSRSTTWPATRARSSPTIDDVAVDEAEDVARLGTTGRGQRLALGDGRPAPCRQPAAAAAIASRSSPAPARVVDGERGDALHRGAGGNDAQARASSRGRGRGGRGAAARVSGRRWAARDHAGPAAGSPRARRRRRRRPLDTVAPRSVDDRGRPRPSRSRARPGPRRPRRPRPAVGRARPRPAWRRRHPGRRRWVTRIRCGRPAAMPASIAAPTSSTCDVHLCRPRAADDHDASRRARPAPRAAATDGRLGRLGVQQVHHLVARGPPRLEVVGPRSSRGGRPAGSTPRAGQRARARRHGSAPTCPGHRRPSRAPPAARQPAPAGVDHAGRARAAAGRGLGQRGPGRARARRADDGVQVVAGSRPRPRRRGGGVRDR